MKFVVLALLLMSSVAGADPLKVEFTPATLTWKPKQPVKVTLKVTNTSTKKVTLRVMSCSWSDQFAPSTLELHWNVWGCDKNVLGHYVLDPAKSHEWTGEMVASEKLKPGTYPLAMTLKQAFGDTASNSVSITVTK
jgi:hypothetical protein